MELNTWFLFVMAELVIALMPGPAVLLVTTQALKYNARHSFFGAMGILLVNLCYYVLSSLGVVALIISVSNVLEILKFAGAIYLFVTGVLMICQTYRKSEKAPTIVVDNPRYAKLLWQGMLTELSNPKAVIFFMAFLPQFIKVQYNVPLQFAILCFTGTIIEAIVLLIYALVADRGRKVMNNNPRTTKIKDRIAGLALIVVAVRLCFKD